MDVARFRRVIGCFAESQSNIDISRGEFVVQLRDEVIAAKLVLQGGDLYVEESGLRQLASSWIVSRVAKLSTLADRIIANPGPSNFVTPKGVLLSSLEADPQSSGVEVVDAVEACEGALSDRIPGTTSVLYLTSDAGEGKTTLISVLARRVAEKYRRKEVDWLLLPVTLGGRTFLRFDEVVVGALMNRLRFPYWFYEGFIELVKMGVVVPAFDGFEEMIVEGSSGEAVSALGNFVNQLGSEGSVLFAARKAFFEYQSFKTQARLFDAVGREDSVAFSRLSLNRWTKDQFIQYGKLRGRSDVVGVYDQVAAKCGVSHPLVTRAVLVRRLFDVVESAGEVGEFIVHLGVRSEDFFHQFVIAIIEREASEKWLDKEGREGQALLSVEEHLELLSAIAREMWVASAESLRADVLMLVADLFCEEKGKSPTVSRQLKERLLHHALIVADPGRSAFRFDHEDFRHFFTGLALGSVLARGGKEDIRSFLRIATMAGETSDEAVRSAVRTGCDEFDILKRVLDAVSGESPTSFAVENAGNIALRLLDGGKVRGIEVVGLALGPNAFRARSIQGVVFKNCYVAPTSFYKAHIKDVRFESCKFERMEFSEECDISAIVSESEVLCAVEMDGEVFAYNPADIRSILTKRGFDVTESGGRGHDDGPRAVDAELAIAERVIRAFLRATQINEATFRVKLGNSSAHFFSTVLPALEEKGVLKEVAYKGSGTQRRFRLAIPMADLQAAISTANGSFDTFLRSVSGA